LGSNIIWVWIEKVQLHISLMPHRQGVVEIEIQGH